jgi:hypothetical protein
MQFCSYAVMQFVYPVRDNLSVEKKLCSYAVLQSPIFGVQRSVLFCIKIISNKEHRTPNTEDVSPNSHQAKPLNP